MVCGMNPYPYRGAEAKLGPEPSYTHHPVEDIEPLEDGGGIDNLTPEQVEQCAKCIRETFLWCLDADSPLNLSRRLFLFMQCFSPILDSAETLEAFADASGGQVREMRVLRRSLTTLFERFVQMETVVLCALLVALRRLAEWLRLARSPIQIAQRGFIIGYCLDPAMVGGQSLESFGRKTGVKRQRMHALRKEFTKIFSIRSPHQK